MTSIHLCVEQGTAVGVVLRRTVDRGTNVLGFVNSIVFSYTNKLLGWKYQLIVRDCTFFDCLVGSRDHGA